MATQTTMTEKTVNNLEEFYRKTLYGGLTAAVLFGGIAVHEYKIRGAIEKPVVSQAEAHKVARLTALKNKILGRAYDLASTNFVRENYPREYVDLERALENAKIAKAADTMRVPLDAYIELLQDADIKRHYKAIDDYEYEYSEQDMITSGFASLSFGALAVAAAVGVALKKPKPRG